MSGPPVTVVASGGMPVRQVESGAPVLTAVESGGAPITLSDHGAPYVVEGLSPGGLTIAGPRMAVVGDSRAANGVTSQASGEFASTTVMKTRLRSIPEWMNHTLGFKTRIVGNWSLGGAKTSEVAHDAALAAQAATDPHLVYHLCGTNDPVDYTGSGGLGTMPLGDPDADPATLARVGSRRPTFANGDPQGTTLGNIDKELRFWGDPVANGTGRVVPVLMHEIPTANAGRTQRNADVHKWLMKHKALGTYPNLIAPDVYNPLLATPGADDGPTATGLWRTDLNASVGVISGNGGDQLHPSGAGARFLGEMMATDADVIAAMASLPSTLTMPDGTNDALFLNSNPSLAVQTGGTTMTGTGTTPTGSICAGHRVRNAIPATGTSSVTCSATPGGHGQRLTITRTGGSGTTARVVDFRTADFNRTIVAGDVFEFYYEIVIPARPAGDLYSVAARINFFKLNLVDAAGNNIATGAYEGFGNTVPDPFPLDGDTLVGVTPPLIITPAMVASASGGTLPITGIIEISFPDNLDTATNGPLVVDILRCGLRKVA